MATTYISHLSQLLQEDDLRATHDTNNNTTAAAVGVKPTAAEQHAHYPKVESNTKGSQKGLLHPVKVRQGANRVLLARVPMIYFLSYACCKEKNLPQHSPSQCSFVWVFMSENHKTLDTCSNGCITAEYRLHKGDKTLPF